MAVRPMNSRPSWKRGSLSVSDSMSWRDMPGRPFVSRRPSRWTSCGEATRYRSRILPRRLLAFSRNTPGLPTDCREVSAASSSWQTAAASPCGKRSRGCTKANASTTSPASRWPRWPGLHQGDALNRVVPSPDPAAARQMHSAQLLVSEVELSGYLREPRRQDARRHQPRAARNEHLVVRLHGFALNALYRIERDLRALAAEPNTLPTRKSSWLLFGRQSRRPAPPD